MTSINNDQSPVGDQEEKKKKGLDIDEHYDFVFTKKLSPILRWMLILPMGLFGFIAVQLAYGFIVNRLLGNLGDDSIIAIIITAIFNVMKFLIVMIAMIATVPVKNKLKAGFVLSVFPVAFVIFMIYGYMNVSSIEGLQISAVAFLTQLIAILAGVAYALWDVKNHMNKLKSMDIDSPAI